MLTSIRCDQCGYESESRYRFCGMCGAKLPLPPYPVTETVTSPEPAEAVRPVNTAPSFLGLNEEPTGSVTYLLEDELSASHWGRTVVLVVLLAALAIAGWHWRTQLRAYVTARLAQEPNNNSAEAAPPAPISTSAPEAAPSIPNANAPRESVADLPASPPQSSAPSVPGPAPLPPASPSARPDQSAPNQAQAAPGEAPQAESGVPESTEPQVQKPSPVRPSADQLEAEGEKYLYGTGVPVNCDRAQKNLFAAAGQSNAKAYSVLGTMYATGHCTDRDLPLAYHWFAKALHEDPANARLQRDLQVLWSQMSADERQIAMSTRR